MKNLMIIFPRASFLISRYTDPPQSIKCVVFIFLYTYTLLFYFKIIFIETKNS